MKTKDVIIGHLYIHITSNEVYTVLEIANTDSVKWPTTVVYVDNKRRTWARPISEFIVKFKPYT